MASYRLGDTARARQCLDEAGALMEGSARRGPPGPLAPDAAPPWETDLEQQLLYREARDLILGGSDRPPG
jgi:hypothetical protein